MRLALPTRRRLASTAAILLAAVLLASSCSLDADVATDGDGRIIGIDLVQIRSEALDIALAVAIEGRQMVLELRWRQFPAESSFLF